MRAQREVEGGRGKRTGTRRGRAGGAYTGRTRQKIAATHGKRDLKVREGRGEEKKTRRTGF